MSDFFLAGKNVGLRGLCADDVKGNWFNWFNDKVVTRYMFNGTYPNTLEGMQSYYETTCVNNPSHLVLAIIDTVSAEHVGNIGLHNIDHLYRRAELGIVLGEKSYWGKGLGSEACQLICEHGFARLNLHKIFLRTEAENIGAVKAFEKAGFVQEAVLKDEIYREGKFRSSVYMGCYSPYDD